MRRLLAMTVPHDGQRYETVGDWFTVHGCDLITISDMNNWKYERLVLVHELIEAMLCEARGISEEAVTAFDKAFEEKREPGNTDEPGHDPTAPYHREHVFAEHIERLLAEAMGVDWTEYDNTVAGLSQ